MTEPNDQGALDDADEAAGYRVVLDQEDADDLPESDPNVAAATGENDHENHIGEPADDDGGVSAAGARL